MVLKEEVQAHALKYLSAAADFDAEVIPDSRTPRGLYYQREAGVLLL